MPDLCQSSASSCFFHVSSAGCITAILFIAAPIMARWCDLLVADSNAKTFYTKEAAPVDHRGRSMWSWTADQLRQICATEFYRLDDGTMSTRFWIERGADPYMPQRLLWCKPSELPFDHESDGFAALSERRRLERVSGFLCVKPGGGIIPASCKYQATG